MDPTINNPHDKFAKEMLSQKSFAIIFLTEYLPREVKDCLDMETLTYSPNSFINESLEERFSDIVFKVQMKEQHGDCFVSILIENKANPSKYVSIQVLEYLSSAYAAQVKAKEKIQELNEFVARFSANKSKARQATSRLKQADKLKENMVEIKPSSRQSPFIRFEPDERFKLHRQAFMTEELSKAYDKPLFSKLNISLDAGERLAIIGANGAGKTTLLNILAGAFDEKNSDVKPDTGVVKWAEKAHVGYYPQDHEHEFTQDVTLSEWMREWTQEGDDEQVVRGTLGRLLFGGDDVIKKVGVLSGGEKGRMLYGKLILQRPNVLIMDEPTNHMDMESIEALNYALEKYKGTVIFVSHDRQFVSSLATQIIELDGEGHCDYYMGDYEGYLSSKGIE